MKTYFFLVIIFLAGIGCADDTPPAVEAVPLDDVRDQSGPYHVSATVQYNRGIETLRIFHRDAEDERAEIVIMEEINPGHYEGSIPGRPSGTKIHWFVEAEDIFGNFGYSPYTAEWGDRHCYGDQDFDDEVPPGGAAFCFRVLFQ